MKNIQIDLSRISSFVTASEIESYKDAAQAANRVLVDKSGKGNEFLGWVNLPSSISSEEIDTINRVASDLKSRAEIIICIGIGGSYLGAKAIIEAISNSFSFLDKKRTEPTIIFAGQNISEDYISELMGAIKEYSIATIMTSKSGTTTEPAIAFRIIKAEIEARYGKEEASKRIVAITDGSRGTLKALADKEGYSTFVIPDNVGGRFSIFTPVGLFPLAAAGLNVEEFVRGAKEMEIATGEGVPFEKNLATIYAAARNAMYKKGYKIEILASYEPKLQYIAEWWKQLYGESEGKDGLGIFPASVVFTADLHSMGQYIQEGERNLFETVISVGQPNSTVTIEKIAEDLDGLNFLAGKRLSDVNKMAELGTTLAHVDGGVPNIKITLPEINEYYIGALMYMFERACGISGYILGVNPFDQPGVEAYKKNMFALLEKPGYENDTIEIRKKL